jgi:hypothetical protein
MRVFPFAGSSGPRLPFEKSYSALIVFHLMPRSLASRYEPGLLTTKHVDNNQDYSCATHANRHKPFFVIGIGIGIGIGIELMDGEWVVKHGLRIREGCPVSCQVTGSLRGSYWKRTTKLYARYTYTSSSRSLCRRGQCPSSASSRRLRSCKIRLPAGRSKTRSSHTRTDDSVTSF